MATTLFCGNLAWEVTDEDLMNHVKSLGVKGVTETSVSMRGERSKGWALIHFDTAAHCSDAVDRLNDTELEGRELRVREDRPKEDRPRRERAAAPASSAPVQRTQAAVPVEPATPSNVLYVGNLPWTVTGPELTSVFAEFNPVSAEVHKRLSGRSKGFATVKFKSVQAAEGCMNKFNEQDMAGRPLKIRFDRVNQSGPSSRLFVGNLPWSADDDAVTEMFAGFRVTSAQVKMVGQRSRGYAVVEFADLNEAKRALETKSEFEFEDRTVFCRYDRQ